MSYEDETEDPFDLMDQEEIEDYNRKYLSEVERSGSVLEEDVRNEIFNELQQHHNVRRSADGAEDGRRSFLEAKNAIESRDKAMDSGTKSYLSYVDRRDGPGSGSKLLKRSQARPDDGYLDSLKREGKINE